MKLYGEEDYDDDDDENNDDETTFIQIFRYVLCIAICIVLFYFIFLQQ